MSGRVIVVGSVNIDLVARVPHLPHPGETVTGGSYDRHHGGKGGNQAVAAARLRRPTLFIGALGDDTFEVEARRALATERVDVSMVASLPGQATGVALILYDANGENQIVVIPGANGAIETGYARDCLSRLGRLTGDVVLVCNEVPLNVVREALICAHAAGATTVLNPAPATGIDRSVFALADIVTPNRNELSMLLHTEARRTGRRTDASQEIPSRARLLLDPGPEGPGVRKAVIVTLGAAGVMVLERAGAGLGRAAAVPGGEVPGGAPAGARRSQARGTGRRLRRRGRRRGNRVGRRADLGGSRRARLDRRLHRRRRRLQRGAGRGDRRGQAPRRSGPPSRGRGRSCHHARRGPRGNAHGPRARGVPRDAVGAAARRRGSAVRRPGSAARPAQSSPRSGQVQARVGYHMRTFGPASPPDRTIRRQEHDGHDTGERALRTRRPLEPHPAHPSGPGSGHAGPDRSWASPRTSRSKSYRGQAPWCPKGGVLGGCTAVANSQYSRPFFNVPVAVYGVFLSITLFCLAIYWWRTNNYRILLAHYGLSLVGVLFEGWFQFAQIFLIGAVCIWCESYGISLVLRFLIALWVYLRTPKPEAVSADEPA